MRRHPLVNPPPDCMRATGRSSASAGVRGARRDCGASTRLQWLTRAAGRAGEAGKASWSASSQIRHAPGMSRPAILTNRAEGSSNQSGSGAATVRDGSPVTGSHCGACYSSLLQGAAGGGVSAISSFTAWATTSRYRGLRPIRKCQHSAPHQVTPFTHPFRCYDAMTPRVRKKNLQFSVIPA